MPGWQKILEKMRQNPHDWRVDSLEAVARALGFTVRNPRGSHVVFLHHKLEAITTVPARRPLKPVYIRHFLSQVAALEA
jgi:YcfA-like protein.